MINKQMPIMISLEMQPVEDLQDSLFQLCLPLSNSTLMKLEILQAEISKHHSEETILILLVIGGCMEVVYMLVVILLTRANISLRNHNSATSKDLTKKANL